MSQTENMLDPSYVLTLEEIASLAEESSRPAETLTHVVALIARRFQTDVCSAYLLEPDRANLVLAATLGLSPACVGALHMGLQEGLVGLVAELPKRPVQFVFAGMAHPRDEPGKKVLQQIAALMCDSRFADKFVFIED